MAVQPPRPPARASSVEHDPDGSQVPAGPAAPCPSGRGDAGQALPVVAGVVALVVVLALGAVRLGTAVQARARAHTAADAAALAGAAEGRQAAEQLALANGARVESYREDGTEVEVEVVLDGVRAVARARLEW